MRLTHYDEHKKRWQINDDYGAVMIDELNYAVGEAIDKLAAYEDAEEQGLLVRLPCKVGDTCYITQRYCKRIIVAMVSKITSYTHGNDGKEHEWLIHYASKDYGNGCVAGSDFGKTVFLNREEAEAALKGETMYDELVKALRERADALYNASRLYDSDAEDAAILYKAADAIEELMRRCEQLAWTPVTEGLPVERINPYTRDFEFVLCRTIWGDVRPFKYGTQIGQKKAHFWNGAGYVDAYVTHWMQLPTPPKEENET